VTSDEQILQSELLLVNPELRDACNKEVAALLAHTLNPRTRLLMIGLLLLLLLFTAVGMRGLLFYNPGPLVYGVWVVYTSVCALGSLWIGRSLWLGRFLWKSYFPVADLFTVAATVITVLAVAFGQLAPADPSSTFGVFHAFAFLAICIGWSLHNRIAAAELVTREHLLRIECRLADIAGRIQK
jgi:hypothetical protein